MPGRKAYYWSVFALLTLWLGAAVPLAEAQEAPVSVRVDSTDVGLEGHVRRGTWTPMRLSVTNRTAEYLAVICRWVVQDFDGDPVFVEREVTLNPQREEGVWLYAAPMVERDPRQPWTVQVLEAETGQLLAETEVVASNTLGADEQAMGVMASSGIGLEAHAQKYTQHEAVQAVRGLSLSSLPDRWYGLADLQAMVWTPQGGDPDDPGVSLEIQQSVREWVRRGGHLVVMLPSVGQTWTDSPLADLLPVGAEGMRRVQRVPPSWLGSPQVEALEPIDYLVFDVEEGGENAVLLRDRAGDPTVVARREGFGRVTVMGVDLTDQRIAQMGLPNGRYRVWHGVFHWQSPAVDRQVAEVQISDGEMGRPTARNRVELGRFIPPLIAMRGTTAPAMLVAIFVFGLYWLLAGPVGYTLLKRRGLVRHSWLAFLAIVTVFAALSWGGAWVMQPRQPSVSHFSVVDLDGQSGEAHTRSWFSLYVPEFGRAEVAVAPEAADGGNLLASPGLATGPEPTSFLDPQSYTLDGAAPYRAEVPVRSTAKQFELDYMGRLDGQQAGLSEPWIMPRGEVEVEGFWPSGELMHGLPGNLRDVLVIYSPGEGQIPWVWRVGSWEARTALELGQPENAHRLVRRPREYTEDRNWESEGFLGQLIGRRTGQRFVDMDPMEVAAADNDVIQAVEMLSFYSALPPPNFRVGSMDLTRRAVSYDRGLGRSLDMTPMIGGRRLIVLGYLEDAPLPAPLTLDGQTVGSRGWTAVRWVYDLE